MWLCVSPILSVLGWWMKEFCAVPAETLKHSSDCVQTDKHELNAVKLLFVWVHQMSEGAHCTGTFTFISLWRLNPLWSQQHHFRVLESNISNRKWSEVYKRLWILKHWEEICCSSCWSCCQHFNTNSRCFQLHIHHIREVLAAKTDQRLKTLIYLWAASTFRQQETSASIFTSVPKWTELLPPSTNCPTCRTTNSTLHWELKKSSLLLFYRSSLKIS